jgi:hypothetical protein
MTDTAHMIYDSAVKQLTGVLAERDALMDVIAAKQAQVDALRSERAALRNQLQDARAMSDKWRQSYLGYNLPESVFSLPQYPAHLIIAGVTVATRAPDGGVTVNPACPELYADALRLVLAADAPKITFEVSAVTDDGAE